MLMMVQFSGPDESKTQKVSAIESKKKDQQKISQHNECKDNSTSCTNTALNDIPLLSTKSSHVKERNYTSKQANSNNQYSQVDTPLVLPFP
jgi:hypothetical protein